MIFSVWCNCYAKERNKSSQVEVGDVLGFCGVGAWDWWVMKKGEVNIIF